MKDDKELSMSLQAQIDKLTSTNETQSVQLAGQSEQMVRQSQTMAKMQEDLSRLTNSMINDRTSTNSPTSATSITISAAMLVLITETPPRRPQVCRREYPGTCPCNLWTKS